jgi:hypothetical protein
MSMLKDTKRTITYLNIIRMLSENLDYKNRT